MFTNVPHDVSPEDAREAIVLEDVTGFEAVGLGECVAEVRRVGDGQWQSAALSPADSRDSSGKALTNWQGCMELKLGPKSRRDPRREFRDLRWTVDEGS